MLETLHQEVHSSFWLLHLLKNLHLSARNTKHLHIDQSNQIVQDRGNKNDNYLGIKHEDVVISDASASHLKELQLKLVEEARNQEKAITLLSLCELDVYFIVNNLNINDGLF